MGRITQASEEPGLPEHELKPIHITQWKLLKLGNPEKPRYRKGIEVMTGNTFFFIHDISLEAFHQINHDNITLPFKYNYVKTGLICHRCSGSGIIDWIARATPNNELSITKLRDSLKYIRNKKGPINEFLTYWSENTLYTSTPKIRKGEYYCPECYGCGVRLGNLKHLRTTTLHIC